MKNIRAFMALCMGLFTACGSGHFITDREYRDKVHEDFLVRKEFAAGRREALFGVMDGKLTAGQREAMEFLYAYMPLCDLSEYDGEFFLRQVDGAFRARDFFHWGRTVPEDIFRHFVLVHRANNEYLDDARDVFFGELKDRIKDMSMYDAALEVNHWCHEKMTYRGTDARTSSPLASVRTSWGRCGEESTLTTAALRAVGIPARQCYTPRWAHTDDNHAWVEVWIDGKWYYMGACEPEPELNVAWFDGPVQRAMMVHTTVYGAYDGPETRNFETPLYSVVNTLHNYARTRSAKVRVTDAGGNPVEGAKVGFKIYNYAQLSSLVTVDTDAEGLASVDTGMGDVLVWASKEGVYGYVKSAPGDDMVEVVLDRRPGEAYTETYVMSPPPEQPFRELPAGKTAANAIRLAREDSIRMAYMATFADEAFAARLAAETGLPEEYVWRVVNASQGNWEEMSKFLREAAGNPDTQAFLSSLKDKDLRDTPAGYLMDHLVPARKPADGIADAQLAGWVLSPRIGNELIKPWRGYLSRFLDADPAPDGIDAIIARAAGIRVSDADNYYTCSQTPQGVNELGVADRTSRDIYFVALCRTAGIPARLEPASRKPQYMKDGEWYDVVFDRGEAGGKVAPKGRVTLLSDNSNVVTPAYQIHYTLARYGDGDFRTLDLHGSVGRFPCTVELDEGYYRLLTGSRANDGSVTIASQFFTVGDSVGDNKPQTLTVKLPEVEGLLFVKGVVDMNSLLTLTDGTKTSIKQLSRGKGAILIFADPDKEPTKHILQDFPAASSDIGEWGGAVVIVVPGDKMTDAFDRHRFDGLPSQTVWAVDDGRALLNAAAGASRIQFSNNFPLALYLTNNGGVIYSSSGYSIGIPSEIVRTIRLEEQTKK